MQENFGVFGGDMYHKHPQQSLPIIPTSYLHSGPSWNASSGRKMPWKLWREPPNCSTALEMMQLDDGRKHERRLGWARQMSVKILVETSNDRRSYRKFSFVPYLCCQILDHISFLGSHSHLMQIHGDSASATLGISPLVSLPMYRCRLMSSQLLRSLNTGSNWYQWSGSRDNLQDS